jgi:hypothetical protein
MNTIKKLIFSSVLMAIAGPAYSSTAVHIFACQEGDDASEEKIEALASKWLKAANSMKGGENIKARILYPSAANLKDGDLLFVVEAPSHAAWGAFWDSYKDSPAEVADAESRGIVICPDSNLFEAVDVK